MAAQAGQVSEIKMLYNRELKPALIAKASHYSEITESC